MVIGTAGAFGLGAPLWAPPLLGTLPAFRIERVQISGTAFVDSAEIRELAAVPPNASVWDDGAEWEARVRAHEMVREARVRRVGMRAIEIRVIEVEPLALVPDGTLVPLDESGRRLPLDPSAEGLDLPILSGDGWMEEGRISDTPALTALRALGALREYDDAVYGLIAEVRLLGAASIEIELRESGRAERVLLPAVEPVRGLRRVEMALGHAADSALTIADARFEGQVILRTREEG